MEVVIQEIFRDTQFDETELQLLLSKLTEIKLKKKEFLLKPGENVEHFYYIHSGCLRAFFEDGEGRDHTLQFAIKGWWISDYIALFGKENSKSVTYIECIKDAKLTKISKKDFEHVCTEIPKISQIHIKNLESAFAAFQRRILENLTLSAKERYKKFINSYPNIEQNIKNYHIASFLGITSESLSRIRKEIANE